MMESAGKLEMGAVNREKKTLIFIEDGSFTYDNRVIREADVLIKDGWNVTVISPKYPEDPFYKKINNKLTVYYYPKPNANSNMGQVIEHAISMVLGAFLTMVVFIRHGFTVFHACNPIDILWLIALPYKMLGRKFLFDQHDLCPELYLSRGDGNPLSLFYRAIKFMEKASYRFADAVISTNQSYKAIAVDRGGKKEEEVFVVRNGPDLDKFKNIIQKSDLKKDGDILVGYLGNMNRSDGVDYLLNAAESIIKTFKRSEIKFVLIGGGAFQTRLRGLSRQMDMGDSVSFTGRIPDKDMVSILNSCDICVQPDPLNPLNDISTMNKALEYMTLGKPVVAFDLKETRVSCGDAALYVRPNDVTEFAEKIIYLTDKPEIRYRMGEIGRERIRNNLAWDYSVSNLLAAYNYVMNNK